MENVQKNKTVLEYRQLTPKNNIKLNCETLKRFAESWRGRSNFLKPKMITSGSKARKVCIGSETTVEGWVPTFT